MKRMNVNQYSKYLLLLVGLLFSCKLMNAQTVYQTKVFNQKRIKTLQVIKPDETFTNPIIELNSDDQILIKFDDMTTTYTRYAYSIVHCDANWQPSSLSVLEYMQGFQGLTIDDFASSFNTTAQYTNYQLLLPNDDVQFKVSGNYAVRVYPEDNPDETIFTACFSVVEPQIGIEAEVSGNTLIDTYQRHQQVKFTILKKNFNITYPQTDLKIRVTQNNRIDNPVTKVAPTGIMTDRIVYDNCRELIFPAGNEYRRMEYLTHKYNGLRVESITYFNPYYHVELTTDRPSSMVPYEYDQDQNGRFYLGCSRCDNVDVEADYYIVHFTLEMPQAKQGKIYLNGDFMYNQFDKNSEMPYNAEKNRYEKALLLKQGNYNYQYLYVPTGETVGKTGSIEGDFHQAENEYTIYVYFRPMGARYDRLIGVKTAHIHSHGEEEIVR